MCMLTGSCQRVTQEIWSVTLQLVCVTSNHCVQVMCSGRPDGRWVGCLLGVQVVVGLVWSAVKPTRCLAPVTTVPHWLAELCLHLF